ncbi:MAG: 3'-5' exonuclease, partial [Acidobacteriota bacterium]
EEERRLFYVAMTRAKRQLYLTQAQRRRVYGEELITDPSRFLEEVPGNIVQFDAASSELCIGTQSFPGDAAPARPAATKPTIGQPHRHLASGATGKFRLGDRVTHATYGVGQVIRVDDDKLDIAFPGKGIKRFVAAAAPLTRLSQR